jgi:hypothetical protein
MMRNFITCTLLQVFRIIKSRRMRGAGHLARMEKEECIQGFGGKQEGKRPLGRPRHRLEDNTKMDVRGIGWGGMGWIDFTQASWLPASCCFLS